MQYIRDLHLLCNLGGIAGCLLDHFDLVKFVKSPTHDAGHITRNCFRTQVTVIVDPSAISDHSSVRATSPIRCSSTTARLLTLRLFGATGRRSISSFRLALANSQLVVRPPDNCNQLSTLCDSTLKTLLDDVPPLKQSAVNRQRQRRPAPWYSAECRTIKAKTRRLEKIFRQKRTDNAKVALHVSTSLCRVLVSCHTGLPRFTDAAV